MSRFLVAVVATLAVASCAYADGTLKKTLLGGNAKCLVRVILAGGRVGVASRFRCLRPRPTSLRAILR